MTSNPVSYVPNDMHDLESIARVGSTRAHLIGKWTSLETIYDVAEASFELLQKVPTIGEKRSRMIKGSAQGVVNQFEAEKCTEFGHEAYIAVYVPRSTTNVASAKTVLDDAMLSVDEQFDAIDAAIAETGFDPVEDDVRIIHADDTFGSEILKRWYDQKVVQAFENGHEAPDRRAVETPWDEYHDNVNWKAPRDRNETIIQMASHVVIVGDGQYSQHVRDECERTSTRWTTKWTVRDDAAKVGLLEWKPKPDAEYHFRGWEVDEVETYRRTANKYTGIGAAIVNGNEPYTVETQKDGSESDQGDPDGLTIVDEDAPDEEYERDDDVPRPRAGSHMDMEPEGRDQFFTQKPAEVIDEESRLDKNNLEDADPGGGLKDEYVSMSTM